ncbi:MAG: hypothetical protein R2847_12410 [Bacteroidia bacterium]
MKLKTINTCFLLFGIIGSVSATTTMVSRTVCGVSDTAKMSFVSNAVLFREHWDTLQQVKFWQISNWFECRYS